MIVDQEVGTAKHQPPIHIVVVELHYHAELIKTLYEILITENFKITIITLPAILEKSGLSGNIDRETLNVFLKGSHESVSSFFGRVSDVIENADVVYFNTIRDYWLEIAALNIQGTSMLRVHNIHCDFTKFSHFNRPIANFFSILSHLIRKVLIGREWANKAKAFDNIDYFMFPNAKITEYARQNNWVRDSKILPPVFPFGYLNDQHRRSKSDDRSAEEVVFAITGKVTNAKKNFDLVFRALKLCLDELDYPVKLILLGNAGQKHAKNIVRNFKSIECEKFKFEYTNGYVSADLFAEKIKEVDFLISPVQVETHFRKNKEVYGKSKMSGIDNDILIYRRPSLVISDYQLDSPLDRVVEYFDASPESLANKILEWVSSKRFVDLDRQFDVMDSYRKDVIAKRFYQLCREIITHNVE